MRVKYFQVLMISFGVIAFSFLAYHIKPIRNVEAQQLGKIKISAEDGCALTNVKFIGDRDLNIQKTLDDFEDHENFIANNKLNEKEIKELRYGKTSTQIEYLVTKLCEPYLFNVRVQLYLLNDDASPNAHAIPQHFDLKGNNNNQGDGSLLLGRKLIVQLLKEDQDQFNAIVAVIAHELAHINQFKFGSHFSRVKYKELHADYMAGWTVGRLVKIEIKQVYFNLENFDETKPLVAIYRIGDNDYNSTRHHGKRTERLRSMLEGIDDYKLTFTDAYQKGMKYIDSVERKDNEDLTKPELIRHDEKDILDLRRGSPAAAR